MAGAWRLFGRMFSTAFAGKSLPRCDMDASPGDLELTVQYPGLKAVVTLRRIASGVERGVSGFIEGLTAAKAAGACARAQHKHRFTRAANANDSWRSPAFDSNAPATCYAPTEVANADAKFEEAKADWERRLAESSASSSAPSSMGSQSQSLGSSGGGLSASAKRSPVKRARARRGGSILHPGQRNRKVGTGAKMAKGS